jgi:hypothetical protein
VSVGAPLAFIGADELRARTPAEPDWIIDGYAAPGAVTLLAKKPKAGGSTLALAMAEAVAADAPTFLGRRIKGGPVVYVSEEAIGTLAHKLAATNRIRVLSRERAWPKPTWGELIRGSIDEAERVGAVMLVIDTLPYWAQLPREAQNDAGVVQETMEPLLRAAKSGLALLIPVHQRKGGGEDGEAVAGATAITGAADIVLELERTQRPRERVLLSLSRYPTTPGSLIVHQDAATGAWSAIAEGERTDARSIGDRLAILDALEGDVELTRAELEETIGAPERQWHGQLDELIASGQVQRLGAGRKGDPYRFRKLRTKAAQAGAQEPRSNGVVSAAHPKDAAEPNYPASNGAQDLDPDQLEYLESIFAEHEEMA